MDKGCMKSKVAAHYKDIIADSKETRKRPAYMIEKFGDIESKIEMILCCKI